MSEFEHNEVSDAQENASESYNHTGQASDKVHPPAQDDEWKKLGLAKRVKPSQGFS